MKLLSLIVRNPALAGLWATGEIGQKSYFVNAGHTGNLPMKSFFLPEVN